MKTFNENSKQQSDAVGLERKYALFIYEEPTPFSWDCPYCGGRNSDAIHLTDLPEEFYCPDCSYNTEITLSDFDLKEK